MNMFKKSLTKGLKSRPSHKCKSLIAALTLSLLVNPVFMADGHENSLLGSPIDALNSPQNPSTQNTTNADPNNQATTGQNPNPGADTGTGTGTNPLPGLPTELNGESLETSKFFQDIIITSERTAYNPNGTATISLKLSLNTKMNPTTDKKITLRHIDLPEPIKRLDLSNQVKDFVLKKDGKPSTYEYRILIPAGIQPNYYPIVYTLENTDKSDEKTSYTSYLYINENGESSVVNGVDIRIWDIVIPDHVKVETNFTLSFLVTNYSAVEARNVKVMAELPEGVINMSQNNFNIPYMPPLSSKAFEITLRGNGDLEPKFYEIKLSATPTGTSPTPTDSRGEKKEVGPSNPGEQYTGTIIQGGSGKNSGKTKPMLIIDSFQFYDTDDKKANTVTAGQDVRLDFKLRNTSTFNLNNCKISFSTKDGGIVPREGSNTLYTASIPAGGFYTGSLPLSVLSTAKPELTPCDFNMYYEYGNDGSIETTETLTISVIQPTRIQINQEGNNDPNQSASAMVGQPVFTSFEIINLGKTSIDNLQLKIEGENVNPDKALTFVGNINSGTTTSTEASFNFSNAGDQLVRFIFIYEDASGKEQEKVIEAHYIVDEMVIPEEPMPGENIEDVQSSFPYVYIIIGLVVILLIAGYIYHRRHKKKRQDALDLDD